MTALRQLLHRIRAVFGARGLDRDFDQELESHLELLAESYRHRGFSAEDARRAARVDFGGVAQLRESHREIRGLPWLDTFLQDIQYALRALRRNPGFSALALLTLGIAIGVNTAVFTVYNAAALRPIQAVEPDRMVQLAHVGRNPSFSYAEYLHYRDYGRSFSGLAAATTHIFSMSGAPTPTTPGSGGIASAAGLQFPRVIGGSETVTAAVVSGNYFQLLGVSAPFGRVFRPEEDVPNAQPVAILSDEFWNRRFLRDPSLLGRRLILNGTDVAIVGIAPAGFGGTSLTIPDLWVPIALKSSLAPQADMSHILFRGLVYGRLRPGVSQNQARAELNALEATFVGDSSSTSEKRGMVVGAVSRGGQPGDRDIEGPLLMLGAVGLVLLIACANVASLLLARSAARQREIAIRLAIGASRWRLVRQLLTENAVMSLFAGGAAIVFSSLTLRFLILQMANSPFADMATMALNIAPDQRVLAYILFLSLASTLGFGLAPALESSRPNLTAGLRDDGALFGGRFRKSLLRDLMVGAQVAVCLVLLISAGLLARASARALIADLGFDYRNIVSLEVVFPPTTSAAEIRATRMELARELERTPEIQSVAVASRLPLVHGGMRTFAISAKGGSVDEPGTPDSWYTLVTPSYFETLKIAIVRGRNFTALEAREGSNYDGAPVVVSQATARKLWPGEDPIGKRLAFGPRRGDGPLSDGSQDAHSVSSFVIGVAKDVRSWRLERYDDTDVYLPVTSGYGGTASGNDGRPMGVIALRARGSEAGAIAAVRRVLQVSHPELQITIGDARTAFTTQNAFLSSRLGAIGAAIIGILGLLMTSVGIYGTVAYAVTQRTREIGVRMALGASRSDVFALVLRETMRPVAAGLALGFAGAAMASRLMHSVLFGLSTLDPMAFVGVSCFLTAVALTAGYIPARRAMRVDPMIALRYE